eukprot:4575255-Pleurochrysis_carterae.AAC.1
MQPSLGRIGSEEDEKDWKPANESAVTNLPLVEEGPDELAATLNEFDAMNMTMQEQIRQGMERLNLARNPRDILAAHGLDEDAAHS